VTLKTNVACSNSRGVVLTTGKKDLKQSITDPSVCVFVAGSGSDDDDDDDDNSCTVVDGRVGVDRYASELGHCKQPATCFCPMAGPNVPEGQGIGDELTPPTQ
jgi:hypothetical protein